jgi:hypothetical protein
VIKFHDKTDSKRAKERKVGLASHDPALITDKTNETKEKASRQFETTNKQNKKREKLLPKIKLFFQIEQNKRREFCKTVIIVFIY